MCVETTSICIETTGIETTVHLKDAFKDTTVLNLGSRDGCNKWQNRTCSSGVSRDMNRDAVKSDLGKTFFIQVTVRDRFYPRFLGMSEFLISFRFPWSATGLIKSFKSTKNRFALQFYREFNWKYGQTRLLCSLCAVMFIYLQNYFRLYKCW